MDQNKLKQLLEQFQQQKIDISEVLQQLRDLPFEETDGAVIDHHRSLRQGVPEVIFGEGKSVEQLATIIDRMQEKESNVMGTRVDREKAAILCGAFPEAVYDPLARTLTLISTPVEISGRGKILVVCAGTSDLPVAREAVVTARMLGNEVEEIADVGVAGIHRLLAKTEKLHDAAVIIVVAGMEGALPSVVGGLVAVPVIAVPTSVGYGAAFGGIAALLGMLNSCASGVTVVNIDNGFGAAFAANRINRSTS
ncbi:MAG: 1-(5-phosphoribosyl)-5-amino-4-imidazole-carboxylate carboxylase [Desulfuromonas sp.]|nr:MAG: 1-(5-phosphoribosyl)-5-amino-4-imidazole-carboxylate carboxylase [Desulfuromonas sp.]